MKFGFVIPNNYGVEDPEDVIEVATRAETLGFDSVWVNHHVLHAGYILERLDDGPYYDALTLLSYTAAKTSRVRLGTTVLVLPYFNPIVLAKALATLDLISGGRLNIGIGVGNLKQESDALGSRFSNRGAYADESIIVMKELWTEKAPSHAGHFFKFAGVKFSPKPIQTPHPPLLVGGHSTPALRRVARLGDGWHPTGLWPEELCRLLARLQPMVEYAARSISDITICVRNELEITDGFSHGEYGPLVGNADQVKAAVEKFRNLGVSEIVLSVSTSDADRIRRAMDRFAEEIMPSTQ